MKISDFPLFKNNPPIIPTTPFLWENLNTLLFARNLKTQPFPPFINDKVVPTMT